MRGSFGWLRVFLSALGLCFGFLHQEVGAQDLRSLVGACSGGSESYLAWCRATALAVQASQGSIGLAASGGTDLPGSASTLGWRMKGSPRIALSLRGSITRSHLPTDEGGGAPPEGEDAGTFSGVTGSATVGVFDGFSLAPTVGGFGSLDLVAYGHWVSTPQDRGLSESAAGWGIGTRVGILRESFSLPGISASVVFRRLGRHTLWDLEAGDPSAAEFDLRVTSLRGVVGKDVLGFGLFAGAGWERYSGQATISVSELLPGNPPSSGTGEIRSARRLYFLGGSKTFLTLQISGEVGWADGFHPLLPGPAEGKFDPGARSEFGALAIRLTF